MVRDNIIFIPNSYKINKLIPNWLILFVDYDSNGSSLFEVDSDESYRLPGPLDTVSDSLSDEFRISTNLIETNVIQPDENEVIKKNKKNEERQI